MQILRSWPARVPPGRAHVQDDLPKLVIEDYDYRALAAVDDDVLLLEWDIAVGKEDLEEFGRRASLAPERVLVAPYRLYAFQSGNPCPSRWAHRRYEGTPETGRLIHVEDGDPVAHLWGLGMTYLPKTVIRGFVDAWGGHVSDGSLSGWHYRNVRQDVPIAWDIRPVHLHYSITEVILGGQDQ